MDMTTLLERRLEEISKLLDNLRYEMKMGTPVIVEGWKDVESLKKLSLNGDIITAKAYGKDSLKMLEEIEARGKGEVILLMDFDKYGREMTKLLLSSLERMKIKPNLLFWKRLAGLVGRDLKDVEGLSTYLETIKRKIGKNI